MPKRALKMAKINPKTLHRMSVYFIQVKALPRSMMKFHLRRMSREEVLAGNVLCTMSFALARITVLFESVITNWPAVVG